MNAGRMILLALVLAAAGCRDTTAPRPDADLSMYGTWSGTLDFADATRTVHQNLALTIGRDEFFVSVGPGGAPAELVSLSDPNISFDVHTSGYVLRLSGQRNGHTLGGTVFAPGLTWGRWTTSFELR